MTHADFFKGKLFSGPMVRASCLPFRLLCLEYGADGVYGPATSCDAILSSHIDSSDPYTLYFGWPDNPYVHFKSHPLEAGKLVFQILTNDPAKAVQAAEKVIGFASAIDLNCGCPESFATSRGAGSALMNDPQTVSEVVAALTRNYSVPITVKHRIHRDVQQSIQFAVACENAGASAITVHGRLREQKNAGTVAYDDMKLVFQNAIDYWEPEGYLHLVFIGQYGLSELDRLSAGLDTRTEEEWLKRVEDVTKKLAADIARKPAGSKTARLAEEMRRKADEVPELTSYDIVNLVNRLNSLHDDAKREVVIEVLKQMEGIETDALDERIDAERLSPLTLRALKAFVDRSDE